VATEDPQFSAVPPVLINFWDVSARHQLLFLTVFDGLAVPVLTPVMIMMMMNRAKKKQHYQSPNQSAN